MKRVALFGTFDTKGPDNDYLRSRLMKNGLDVVTIDMGMRGTPFFSPDFAADKVAIAGGKLLEELNNVSHEKALDIMSDGAANIVAELQTKGDIHGAIAMGGSQGTYMASKVMRCLPVGFPKVLISTVATIDRAQHLFRGINDTMVMNSLLDISGVNEVSGMVMCRAADALGGMLRNAEEFSQTTGRRIGITMWGVTTPCASRIKVRMEEQGYEVLVFHATGMGGPIMEKLAEQGYIKGIIDLTLPEVSNPLVGGNYPYDPSRLTVGGNVPRLVSVGGIDMIEPPVPLPERFKNRKIYRHSKDLFFVRSNRDENAAVGKYIGEKLCGFCKHFAVVLPLRGISAADNQQSDFYDAEANNVLFGALSHAVGREHVMRIDAHINDPAFADAIADKMLDMMKETIG